MEAVIISTGSFPPVDRSQWLEILRKGRSTRRGDMPPAPSYADLQFEQLRQDSAQPSGMAGAGWTIVQRVDDVDPRRANHQAQEDIAAGATGLAIIFEGAPNAFGYGLPARPEALAAVLHNIQLNRIYLRIDVHPASRASVDWIVELMRRKKVDPARLSLSFGIDPAAIFAGNGNLRMSIEALKALNYHAIACLHFSAGTFRPCEVTVGPHTPAPHFQVPALMQMFTNEVNRLWDTLDPVLLAAYVLWRLNYIHPFVNGNGRTARAACHLILCMKLGGWLPGDRILPELLRANRDAYVAALRHADASLAHGPPDLAPLHTLLGRLLDEQLKSANIG